MSGWDSLCYLAYAQSGQTMDLPLHHGIGYALLLRGFMLATNALQRATAYCNVAVAFLFAGILTGGFVRRFGKVGLLGACSSLLNFAILENFGRTMSEALFILLLTISCFLLEKALFNGRMCCLILSSLAMAAACLTRYAGISFLATSTLIVWSAGKRTLRGFWVAMIYGIVAVLPLLSVMAWNLAFRGTAANRVLAFHLPRLSEFADAGAMVASWVLPDRLWLAFPFLTWTLLALAGVGLFVVCIRSIFHRDVQSLFWWLPVGGYLLFLLAAFTFFDSNISYDRRMLSPIVCFVTGGFCLQARRGNRWKTISLALLLGYLSLLGAWRAKSYVKPRFAHGAGYYGAAWDQSQLVSRLGQEVATRIVYSNADMGFHARGIPEIRGIVCTKAASSWHEIPNWKDAYKNMISDLANGAILARVSLESGFWREEYVPLEQIIHDAGLELLAAYPDGAIWGVPSLKSEFSLTP